MPIWVSGAAGKLGAAVVEKVRAAGTEVVAVDRVSTDGALQVDLRDYRAVAESMAGADSVIHLAAIPSPGGVQPSVLVENNTMSTFNVFEAAAQRGIDRVVIASSGSIYGYAWSPTTIDPAYVPVDEATPFEFVDPYALTKDLGERIGAMFARRGMTVLALRLHWIVAAHELRHLRDRFDAEDGVRNLWGYVELDDAARACVLAATAELSPGEFHPIVIAAADTMMRTPTAELLDQWFPKVERRRPFTGTAGGFDCTRAQRVIGWRPEFTWDEVSAPG